MCGGGKPSTPPPPPVPPRPVQQTEVKAATEGARVAQEEKAKSATGIQSTVLTGAGGLDEKANTKKKVLG